MEDCLRKPEEKKGGESLNKKIKKYQDEIKKTEKKIAELQQYLKGVQTALKQEEDNEMIRCIRGMKMESGQLYGTAGWYSERNSKISGKSGV